MSKRINLHTIIVAILVVAIFALFGCSVFGGIQQSTATSTWTRGIQNPSVEIISTGTVSKTIDNDGNITVFIGNYGLKPYDRIWISQSININNTGQVIALKLKNGECYTLAKYLDFDWNFIGKQTNNMVYITKRCQ